MITIEFMTSDGVRHKCCVSTPDAFFAICLAFDQDEHVLFYRADEEFPFSGQSKKEVNDVNRWYE